jgi:HK97 family phage portal protein
LSLVPFEPQYVTVKQDVKTLELRYEIRPVDGEPREFPAEMIWHVRGASWNSYLGLETVKLARESIGLAMAVEEASGGLHKNGVRPSGVYSVDGTLSPEQYKSLSGWIEKHAGPGKAGGPLILDRAAKWVSTQMTGVDAQTLEQRKFQIEEMCRAMGVMPIIVGYSDKASTYASAEQMFLAHERLTLAPFWKMIEQSIDANLLTEKERAAGVFAAFTDEGMRRGSMKDKKDTILALVNGGLLTPNEGRALYDRNPDPDEASDKLRIPQNIAGKPEKPEGEAE